MNNVTLIGRMTKDPQVKTTGSGKSVANFTIAVDREGKPVEGQPSVDFFNVVVWNATANAVGTYCHKGSLVAVSGRLQNRSYEQEGRKVYVTEVIAEKVKFLESTRKAQPQQTAPAPNQQIPNNATYAAPPVQQAYQAPYQQAPYGQPVYQQPVYQQVPYQQAPIDFGDGETL